MPAETTAVFLDTEVFDHHNLDIASPNFKRLIRLAAADELELVLTDVTVAEVRSHLDAFAKSAFKQITDYRKVNRVVKNFITADTLEGMEKLTEMELAQRFQGELDKFVNATGAQILSVNRVSPSEIFERYFQAKAPFNDKNKKVEFPDAFAGATLQAWCRSPPGRKIYIVSGDSDWRRLSQETDEFIFVKALDQLLELFADAEVVTCIKEAINHMMVEVLKRLTERVQSGDIFFFVDDSASDGEVVDIEDVDIAIEDLHVVEAKGGVASLTLRCNVKVTLAVTADDPDSSYRDPDDGDFYSVWSVSGSVERELEMDATVDVTYDVNNPHAIAITSVSFQDKGVSISVEEDELTRDDREDRDDAGEEYDSYY